MSKHVPCPFFFFHFRAPLCFCVYLNCSPLGHSHLFFCLVWALWEVKLKGRQSHSGAGNRSGPLPEHGASASPASPVPLWSEWLYVQASLTLAISPWLPRPPTCFLFMTFSLSLPLPLPTSGNRCPCCWVHLPHKQAFNKARQSAGGAYWGRSEKASQ